MTDDETNQGDAPEVPMADDELVERLAKFSPAEACNLRVLYHKYLQGETQKWQEEKLIACGIIGRRSDSQMEMPPECSQTQMAAHLTENYGKPVGKEYFTAQVASWIKTEGAPAPGANRKLNTADFIKWFMANKWEGGATNGGGDSSIGAGAKAKQELYVVQLRRAERADKEEQRKFESRWMITDDHDFWLEGVVTRARQSVLSMLKRVAELAKQASKESGADEAMTEKLIAELRPKLDADFESWQSDFTKQVEELDVAAHESSETKKAELKVKKL
jgi:hypothetical protein